MGRPVILGNGSLTVGINEQGLVHDFYYPYVGLDNLTTARSVHHLIGVWVDDTFSWIDDGSWDISVDFQTDALISEISMRSESLQVELHFNDFVDVQFNALCRRIKVKNFAGGHREIRLFMHQVFEISRGGRADTAMFVPDDNYILDYKGRCSLLIYGQTIDGQVYDQYAIGNYGIEGKLGTFKDAEDGELSGSPIEHGGVDSVIRFTIGVDADSTREIDYWIVAADSQYNAEKIHNAIKADGVTGRLKRASQHWHKWLSVGSNTLHRVDAKYLEPVKKSLMVIKAHTDKRGGIIASADSSIYNFGRDYYSYVWPRDGAFAIWPLIRLGYTDEPRRFFGFCRDILTDGGYLMHKYQPDRAIGSTWHPMLHGSRKELPIQEDETAIVIYMLGEYYDHSQDEDFVANLYTTLIQPAANFLADFIDNDTGLPHASYDLWEEKFLTNTYTVAVTYQALLVAADFADQFEHPDDAVRWREVADEIYKNSHVFFDTNKKSFRKGFLMKNEDGSLVFDNTLDVSSYYGSMMFGLFQDKQHIYDTLSVIEATLLDQQPSGGSPRYERDHYFESQPAYLGNPWFVSTLWIAQSYIRMQKIDKAESLLDWTLDHALPSGVLSEQVNPNDGSPVSVTPLVWSHAELVNTILDMTRITQNGSSEKE